MTTLQLLDYLGVAVFAISGGLVASRKQLDLIGFGLLSTLAEIGGGTTRDLLIGRPVFWVNDQHYIVVCLCIALIIYLWCPFIQWRYRIVLWADAAGIAAYGALGANIALKAGTDPFVAVVMGVMTATFGGLARDIIAGETPVALRQEVHVTAALLSAAAFVVLASFGVATVTAVLIGATAGFLLRGGAIIWGWSLPLYRPRPGRDY